MKEFEKYKLRCCKTCATDVYIKMCYICPAIRERCIGWKAALKFVLEDCEYTDVFGQSNFDSDKIKEELK